MTTQTDLDAEVEAFLAKHPHLRESASQTAQPAPAAPSSQPPSGDYFADSSHLLEAMRDPRYKSSPAYRAEVARWVAGSNARGISIT